MQSFNAPFILLCKNQLVAFSNRSSPDTSFLEIQQGEGKREMGELPQVTKETK